MKTGKRTLRFAVLAAMALSCAAPAAAGELDLLLDRLVEKQVLSPGEAREVLARAKPKRAPGVELRGDMRLRYQFNGKGNVPEARHRGRYRLRLSGLSRINGRVTAGFSFASGGSADPRSTNQTFTGNNAKKDLYIDLVFAEYEASEGLAIAAGRMKNPLWLNSGLLWDGDIRLEGLALRFDRPCGHDGRMFASAGLAILGESAAAPGDPYLLYAQPGISLRGPGGRFGMKAAAALYGFSHIKGAAPLAHRPSAAEYQQANTLVPSGYKYDYDAVAPEIEFSWNASAPVASPLPGPIGFDPFHAAVFGSAVRNLSHSGGASGWMAGLRTGQRKADEAGHWQLRYSYRRLEADAWPDTYPDSDFYGGSTNAEGHEAGLTLGLMRAVTLEIAYYLAGPVDGARRRERLFQADVNMRF